MTERKQGDDDLRKLSEELELRVTERTAALAESEAMYRYLVENTLDITCTVDAGGVIRYVAPQVARYGFNPDDLEGRDFLDIVLPEDRERMGADFRKTLETGEAFPSEFRVRSPDGTTYWFEERGILPRDASGKIAGVTTVLRDVTERHEAKAREQAALRRLQAFEEAVNRGPGVVFRWRIVPNEWPVEMVTANVRQFGYEPEEFLAGRVSWPGITHPEDVPALERQVQAYLENGVHQFHQAYRLITKSGAIRHIEDWNAVLAGPDGNPAHIQAMVMDVTHLREEEQRRKESEERYRRLFEAESDAILVFDPQTRRFVDVNPAALRLYGYTREEFLHLTHRDITAEPEASDESIARIEEGEYSVIPERLHRRKDGTVFPVEISPSRSTLDGRPVLCGIVRDITVRKRAEWLRLQHQEQLRDLAARLASAQDEEQRRVAEGLHDDVAQLLVACSAYLARADKVASGAEAREIREEAAALLKETMDKVRSLSFELSSSTLYRLGLREAVQELCQSMSARHGVRFELEGEGPAATLDEATATVLFKAVRELLFNVVKHAHVKTARITIGGDAKTLHLAVEDEGAGFQTPPADDDLNIIKGLGLFGIRERLKPLGGRMRIESTRGVRTRVSLSVPLRGA